MIYHFIFHFSLYNNIREKFLQHVGNTILNINEKNEIDKIKKFMSKEFVGYFGKIISDMINYLLKLIICLITTTLTDKLEWAGSSCSQV